MGFVVTEGFGCCGFGSVLCLNGESCVVISVSFRSGFVELSPVLFDGLEG